MVKQHMTDMTFLMPNMLICNEGHVTAQLKRLSKCIHIAQKPSQDFIQPSNTIHLTQNAKVLAVA